MIVWSLLPRWINPSESHLVVEQLANSSEIQATCNRSDGTGSCGREAWIGETSNQPEFIRVWSIQQGMCKCDIKMPRGGVAAHWSSVQLCQPDFDHCDLGPGEIIADHVDYRNKSLADNLQYMSLLECGSGHLGRSIDHRSGIPVSRAPTMGLHPREMRQPGVISTGLDRSRLTWSRKHSTTPLEH